MQVLSQTGVKFQSCNILDAAERRQGIKEFSNWPTISQLYVKGEFIGGCDIVRDQAGEFEPLLAEREVGVKAEA